MIEPPTAEWMLWAKRMKDEHAKTQSRIQALESECAKLRETAPDISPNREATGQMYEWEDDEPRQNHAINKTQLKAIGNAEALDMGEQGQQSLEQYFEKAVFQHDQTESILVQRFVEGMRSEPERESLEESLLVNGHTWANLATHAQILILEDRLRHGVTNRFAQSQPSQRRAPRRRLL